MAKATITKIDIQKGTTRTVFVTWSWSKASQTEKYDIRWYYATGDGVRFIANESDKEITNAQLQSVYTAPENAYMVKFQVKPIAKTRKVNGKDTAYWTAEWSTEAVYYFKNNPPSTPPTPNVEIDEYKLKATVDDLDDLNAKEIQFQIVKDDAKVFKTGLATISTSTASFSCAITAGSKYKVRCRSKNGTEYSPWSEYSDNYTTIPTEPTGITKCQALTDTSVYLEWNAVSSADTYDIEYTTDPDYLGNSNASTTITGVDGTNYTITGMESGRKYYIRIRAVNELGASDWCYHKFVVLGLKPGIPTTWSSTTKAMVGEELILYWMHNAEDGSKEYSAILEIDASGTKSTHMLSNPEAEDDVDRTTSKYVVDTSSYSVGTEIKWKVKTAGVTGEYSDWSILRSIDVYAPVTLELHMVDGEDVDIESLTSFPFYIKAEARPRTQSPIGYHVTITANEGYETVDEVGNVRVIAKGENVYSEFHDITDDLDICISASDVDLSNNISYTLTCMASMDSGLSAQDSVEFTVSWDDIAYEPNAEIGFDPDTLSVFIRPYCENQNGDLQQGVTLSVYRREYNGSFIEIGSGLSNEDNTFVIDPHPSLDYGRYRIVAIDDATGAVSYSDIPGYPIGEKAVIIQWDESWSNFDDLGEDTQETPVWSGSLLKLPYNIDVSDKNTADVTLVKYIGRSHPVSYYGTQIGSTATWNVEIAKEDKNTIYTLRRLAQWMGDVYVREPSGSGYWASISVSFNQTHCKTTVPVTLDITRVEGGI